ncbi:hypothetical protein GRJ2_003105700 [Grus japonensis]|uniref:Uncharacterized protein n=1 Tax=Grus japonensis TaxID=30415 RepID=A0ABC9YA05_GRUJA
MQAGHSCAHCSKAAQELQRVMLLAWARPRASPGLGSLATLDSRIWQAAWQDLEELGEQGCLPSHSCNSSISSESFGLAASLKNIDLIPDRAAPVKLGPTCSLGPVRGGRAWSALKMHVARKGLEVQLGALPVPVQLSQQRAAQQQGRRVLPKLIQPGQRQPLPRRGLCPSLQGKADAIADIIKAKEVRRLWGEPNPTEESLALLVPCPPLLLTPLDPQLPQGHSVWRPRALGQASAVRHLVKGKQEPCSWHGSEESVLTPAPLCTRTAAKQMSPPDLSASNQHLDAPLCANRGVCSSIQPPALGNVVRESILCPDGTLPQRKELLWPLGLSLAQPALPSLDNKAAGPAKGPAAAAAAAASVPPKEDAGLHTNIATTRGRCEADLADMSWPNAAAPVGTSKLELSQEMRSKLWVHTARRCQEMKLQKLPMAVQQSMEMRHQSLPQRLLTGPGSPRTHHANTQFLKAQCLFQPDQVAWKQPEASLACPVASATLPSCPAPTCCYSPEATFVPEEQRETLGTHVHARKLQRCRAPLGTEGPSERAVPAEEGSRAALRDSTLPGTPRTAATAPSTSLGPGSSPPVSLQTLRWSRRKILQALESGFQDMVRSRSRPDVPQSPGPPIILNYSS